MSCCNWDSEKSFCSIKDITINFEDLEFCKQSCRHFMPCYSSKGGSNKSATCNECNTKFPLKRNGMVEVKGKEYGRCPKCGSINIRRDDENLRRNTEC